LYAVNADVDSDLDLDLDLDFVSERFVVKSKVRPDRVKYGRAIIFLEFGWFSGSFGKLQSFDDLPLD